MKTSRDEKLKRKAYEMADYAHRISETTARRFGVHVESAPQAWREVLDAWEVAADALEEAGAEWRHLEALRRAQEIRAHLGMPTRSLYNETIAVMESSQRRRREAPLTGEEGYRELAGLPRRGPQGRRDRRREWGRR